MNKKSVRNDVGVQTQRSGDTPSPSGELREVEPELFERAQEAVSVLRGRGRLENGRAGPGNTLNLKHGLRSKQLIQQPDIAAWHKEQVELITLDRGGDAELTALQRASIREVARLEVILGALGEEILQHGVLTGRGKCRAATSVYLSVLDRFARLAATVGLERQARPVPSLSEYLVQREQKDSVSQQERQTGSGEPGGGLPCARSGD